MNDRFSIKLHDEYGALVTDFSNYLKLHGQQRTMLMAFGLIAMKIGFIWGEDNVDDALEKIVRVMRNGKKQ